MKTLRRTLFILAALLAAVSPVAAQDAAGVEQKRPALLMPLYAANVMVHGLDLWTTKQALNAGHREGNPFLENASIGQMAGAKIAASAATVFVVEKLWKRNRVAAVTLMVATNVGLTAVAAHNYRLSRTRPGS